MFMDLTKAGAVAEIRISTSDKATTVSGSGFGAPEFEDWMPRLEHFLKMTGFLPTDRPGAAPVLTTKAEAK